MPHECFHDPRRHDAIGQLTACAIVTCSGPLSASGYTSFFFAQGRRDTLRTTTRLLNFLLPANETFGP